MYTHTPIHVCAFNSTWKPLSIDCLPASPLVSLFNAALWTTGFESAMLRPRNSKPLIFILCNEHKHVRNICQLITVYIHLPFSIYPWFLSLRKEELLPELSPQTPVSGYSWPRRTQVSKKSESQRITANVPAIILGIKTLLSDKVVSPSCFRSSLSSCPFSWCPLCHSFCPSVVFESCNVSRPSIFGYQSIRERVLKF